MKTDSKPSATATARAIVADLWDLLPGCDDKTDWNNTFQALCVVFDCGRQYHNYTGFRLVRQAWKSATYFYNGHIHNPAYPPLLRITICNRIVVGLIRMSTDDDRIWGAHQEWFYALNGGAFRITTYQK
ncbi:hypothetical protein GCM10027347_52890 [Larkinella harenae]